VAVLKEAIRYKVAYTQTEDAASILIETEVLSCENPAEGGFVRDVRDRSKRPHDPWKSFRSYLLVELVAVEEESQNRGGCVADRSVRARVRRIGSGVGALGQPVGIRKRLGIIVGIGGANRGYRTRKR